MTDDMGPRLTGSPGQKRATLWTQERLSSYGLANVHLEKWGPFGRGWEAEQFSAQVTEPVNLPLIAYPKAWSPGLRGTLNADAVYLDAKTVADLDAYKGKLKGKAVLFTPMRTPETSFDPIAKRYTPAELADLTQPPAPGGGQRRRPGGGGPGGTANLTSAISKLLKDEGAALAVDISRGDGGTVYVQSASEFYGPEVTLRNRQSVWEKGAPVPPIPQIVLSSEQYNRIARMVKAGQNVRLSVALKVNESDSDKDGLVANTVAELPGTDKADEVVMCGGHLDSWTAGTGATDNAAGVAVCMEAMRLLKTLHVTPRRTIRIALWTGEEEGLYGSRAYAAQHFGTPEKLLPEQSKVSAYFNLDNGTGKIRGVWGQGNDAVLPIFAAWLQPFNDLGATVVTTRNTGSTDHVSFDRLGVPGFQFVQDGIDYFTRTHHSNQDVYDRLEPDDLKQASLIMAAFLYDAAMRDAPLPRKPFPPPRAARPRRRSVRQRHRSARSARSAARVVLIAWGYQNDRIDDRVRQPGNRMMNDEQLIQHLYDRFNARDMEAVLAALADDVAWANGMEGTHVYGKEAVREYWTYQWSVIDPHVEPVKISKAADNSLVVEVHQTVHDLEGKLLLDETVAHAFRIEEGQVKRFDIQGASQLSAIPH